MPWGEIFYEKVRIIHRTYLAGIIPIKRPAAAYDAEPTFRAGTATSHDTAATCAGATGHTGAAYHATATRHAGARHAGTDHPGSKFRPHHSSHYHGCPGAN